MRAIVVHETGGPEVLRLETVPAPTPAPGEVVVHLHAIGVNPVETYLRAGGQGYTPTLPVTPGSDGAGVVEAVGAGVTTVQVGERVWLSGALTGTYAEAARCRMDQVHSLPDNVSFEEGAAVGVPYTTAYRALLDVAQARTGEAVLVHGASGGTGLAAVQLALAHGCTVVGTAGTAEGRALVKAQGAAYVYDHHTDGYLDAAQATLGRGFDVIVELAAHVNLGHDLPHLARGGRVVVVGSRGPVEINPRDLMAPGARILGLSLRTTPPADLARIHAALTEGLHAGTLRPFVGHRFPLSQAPAAHRLVLEGPALGKIILVPSPDVR